MIALPSPSVIRQTLARRARTGLALAAATAALGGAPVAQADGARFELIGPDLAVTVTRNGQQLPLARVPSLAEGDRLHIAGTAAADSAGGKDQGAHLMVVSAFLRGATNPPPKEWLGVARTWKERGRDQDLTLTVPAGARQMVLLVVPETSGAQGTLVDAVRGKPGEFVRASQDLNQASLDHARLEAFMSAIRGDGETHPEDLRRLAPVLARSLSIKLNEDCLSKVVEQQATCLLDDRDTLVLSDVHTNSLTDTLTGAPTQLAFTLSATPQGGAGAYSPYIGVIRDLARVFGAFSNPQFNYLPTLSVLRDDRVSLRLNTAPSFTKPKSVMVMAMPAIGADSPPQLRSTGGGPLCARGDGDIVLPVEGAPLIFATGFAHDMMARFSGPDGKTTEVPVQPRADRGGYILAGGALPQGAASQALHLHGRWGFDPYEGPDFVVQHPDGGPWNRAAGATGPLVAGRDNEVILEGASPGCLEDVALRVGNGAARSVSWRAIDGGHVAVTVPLAENETGDLRLDLRQQGLGTTATVSLRARAESSRIDAVDVRAGESEALVTGQRLEQVVAVTIGDLEFRPDGLTREGRIDRLHLAAAGTGRAGDAGTAVKATVKLDDGRSQTVSLRIGPARPRVDLLSRTVNAAPVPAGTRPLRFAGDDLLPEDGELVFSLRAAPGTTLATGDAIEVAPQGSQQGLRLTAGKGLMATDPQVVVATLRAADLPPASFGPLRYRLVKGEQAGAWQPLATLARLPRITGVSCDGAGSQPCTITGRALFLLDAVAADDDFARAVTVQPGFTGSSLRVPRPVDGALHLRLRDAPQAKVTLPLN